MSRLVWSLVIVLLLICGYVGGVAVVQYALGCRTLRSRPCYPCAEWSLTESKCVRYAALPGECQACSDVNK